jgi:hypothetical protein
MRILTPPLALAFSAVINKSSRLSHSDVGCLLQRTTRRLRSVYRVSTSYIFFLALALSAIINNCCNNISLQAKMAAASLHHVAAELGQLLPS